MRGGKAGLMAFAGGAMLAALFAAPLAVANNDDQTEVEVRMNPAPGTSTFADGKVRFRERASRGRTDVRAQIEDVALGDYDFFVGGIFRATVTVIATPSGTEGDLQFRNPTEPQHLPLDFDPRGQLVEWRQGGTVVMSGQLGTTAPASGARTGGGSRDGVSNNSRGNSNKHSTNNTLSFDDSSARSNSSGSIQIKSKRNRVDVSMKFKGLDSSKTYLVTADGVEVATVKPRRNGNAKLKFSSRAKGKKLPLTFDPVQVVLEMWDGTDRVLIAPLDGKTTRPGTRSRGNRVEVDMDSTGADFDANGEAELRMRNGGRVDFQVEVEDLDMGSYDLRVDGVVVGTINVAAQVGGGTGGEIEFSSQVDDADHRLPLTFDPAGALLEVVGGGTVYLTVVFPA